jgi:hypothetical protein
MNVKIHILTICVLIIALGSCNSDFNSIEQAKNEVNKQGYREGRWVDYLDSAENFVTDKSKGYSMYFLSEFKDGELVNNIKFYKSNGDFFMEGIPYEGENIKIEKTLKNKILFKKLLFYNSDGTIQSDKIYNSKRQVILEHKYASGKDSISSETSKDYYDNNTLKSLTTKLSSPKDSMFIHYEYREMSDYDRLKEFESVRQKIENKIKQVCNDIKIHEGYLIQKENIQDIPYRLNYLSLGKDTIFIANIIGNAITEYNQNVAKNNQTSNKQSSGLSLCRDGLVQVKLTFLNNGKAYLIKKGVKYEGSWVGQDTNPFESEYLDAIFYTENGTFNYKLKFLINSSKRGLSYMEIGGNNPWVECR